jgi:hypothetical protein
MMADEPSLARLEAAIETSLNGEPDRPRCVHGLCEELLHPGNTVEVRDEMLSRTRLAAEDLVEHGRARRRFVSATAIGAHCEDSVYWSIASPNRELAEFGPDFEDLAIARRLAAHFVCHGL